MTGQATPPLVHELPFRDPVEVLQLFAGDSVVALLDSAAGDVRSRFSYLAIEPYAVVTADANGVRIDGSLVPGDPFSVLEQALGHRRHAAMPVPFWGGAVGYLAYEAARHVDRFPVPAAADGMPEMVAGLYDLVIAFDPASRRCWLIESGSRDRSGAILARLADIPPLPPLDWSMRATWQPDRPRAAVEHSIAQVIEAIHAGDIFQANLTQRMSAARPAGLDDLTLYRRLRSLSPAPFAGFLRAGPDVTICSASPERFLRLDPGGSVETRPIKGTRRRDPDPAIDAALAAELLASVKDKAENLMIVDLMRNDLGRVCRIGSVAVPALNGLETFASVHHLVSMVTGELRADIGPVDLLRACFPGGSITGAPKIRAMEIIAALEPHRRGACFGSLFWIGRDGAMDSSIAIRTLVRQGEVITAQAGGGIVSDSDPAAEYDEAILKMTPLLCAVTGEGYA